MNFFKKKIKTKIKIGGIIPLSTILRNAITMEAFSNQVIPFKRTTWTIRNFKSAF